MKHKTYVYKFNKKSQTKTEKPQNVSDLYLCSHCRNNTLMIPLVMRLVMVMWSNLAVIMVSWTDDVSACDGA